MRIDRLSIVKEDWLFCWGHDEQNWPGNLCRVQPRSNVDGFSTLEFRLHALAPCLPHTMLMTSGRTEAQKYRIHGTFITSSTSRAYSSSCMGCVHCFAQYVK